MACMDKCKTPKRFRYRVVVEKPSGSADAHGHVDLTAATSWLRAGSIRARFATKGGREWRAVDQIEAVTTHIIETPATTFSRTIEPTWRLKFDGRTFGITAAYNVNEERRGVVRIEATESR